MIFYCLYDVCKAFFGPGPGGALAPVFLFGPGPGGAMAPVFYFGPGPGEALAPAFLFGPGPGWPRPRRGRGHRGRGQTGAGPGPRKTLVFLSFLKLAKMKFMFLRFKLAKTEIYVFEIF